MSFLWDKKSRLKRFWHSAWTLFRKKRQVHFSPSYKSDSHRSFLFLLTFLHFISFPPGFFSCNCFSSTFFHWPPFLSLPLYFSLYFCLPFLPFPAFRIALPLFLFSFSFLSSSNLHFCLELLPRSSHTNQTMSVPSTSYVWSHFVLRFRTSLSFSQCWSWTLFLSFLFQIPICL